MTPDEPTPDEREENNRHEPDTDRTGQTDGGSTPERTQGDSDPATMNNGQTDQQRSGFVGPLWHSVRAGGNRIRSFPQRVRETVTYKLFVLMVVVYFVQATLTVLWSRNTTETLFLLTESHPGYVWTWVTHVFAHGNLLHLGVNMIVLISFGSIVEDRLGSRSFLGFFVIAGIVSGLSQLAVEILMSTSLPGLVGASGALAACVGYLTMDSPDIRVLMFFFLPVSLWRACAVFATISTMAIVVGGIGYLGIAHIAHLSGLFLGIIVGIINE